jgi:hypothetical protein
MKRNADFIQNFHNFVHEEEGMLFETFIRNPQISKICKRFCGI